MNPAANDTPCPLWVRHARNVWTQDECAPDAETVDEAWLRMFGEKSDTGNAVDVWDGGDWIGWLMPNNYVYGYGHMGGTIHRATIVAVYS